MCDIVFNINLDFVAVIVLVFILVFVLRTNFIVLKCKVAEQQCCVLLCVVMHLWLSVCLFVCLTICLSVYLSIFLSVCDSAYLCLYLYMCLCLCLWLSQYKPACLHRREGANCLPKKGGGESGRRQGACIAVGVKLKTLCSTTFTREMFAVRLFVLCSNILVVLKNDMFLRSDL